MLNYLIRRLLLGMLTLLLITFLIFGLIRSMPGSPLTVNMAQMDPSRQVSPEQIERLKRIYGLDKHWTVAYLSWLKNLALLDLDRSFSDKRAVSTVIGERIGPTLLLSGSSLVLAYLLSIPMGLWFTARDAHLARRCCWPIACSERWARAAFGASCSGTRASVGWPKAPSGSWPGAPIRVSQPPCPWGHGGSTSHNCF